MDRQGYAGQTWIATAVAIVLFLPFASWDGDLGPEPLWVSLRRTECLGPCPSYKVTVYRDGRVEFVGYNHVAQAGKHEKRIAPEKFRLLWKRIHQVRFWRMADRYTSDWTDHPHQIVTVRTETSEKSVDDYISGPKALKDLENFVDQVAGTSEWVRN